MGDKVKKVVSDVGQKWKAASRKTKGILGGAVLVVLVALVVVIMVASNRPYVTLFADLNQSDLSSILTYLSDNGVTEYKVEGDTILVPEDREAALKAQVLQAGYPSSGYGYDTYFDHVGSLTTESERNQVTLYALQDRIQAVVRNFDGVRDAAVVLTPGEDHTYVLDSGSKVDATASVTVTMEEGKTLTDNQVKAIRKLVSSCLAGLNVENVDILDTYGNPYTVSDDFMDVQDASALKLQLEEQWNNNIRTRVMQALIPIYGEGNVQVSGNTVVDVDRTYTDSTDYNLEDWAEGNDDGIIGTEIWQNSIVRGDEETAGGAVGTETNADLNTYVENQAQPNGNETAITTSGQQDHLVDTTKQQVEQITARIADVMVSVSINQSVAGDTSVNDLYAHVGRAAGITDADQRDKISIMISPFYRPGSETPTEPVVEGLSNWMIYAAIAGVGVFLLLLLLILLLLHRRKVKKRKAAEAEAAAEAAANALIMTQAAPQQSNIMEMQTEKSMELRQDIRKFAEENPEIAAQMVKNWLREGEAT